MKRAMRRRRLGVAAAVAAGLSFAGSAGAFPTAPIFSSADEADLSNPFAGESFYDAQVDPVRPVPKAPEAEVKMSKGIIDANTGRVIDSIYVFFPPPQIQNELEERRRAGALVPLFALGGGYAMTQIFDDDDGGGGARQTPTPVGFEEPFVPDDPVDVDGDDDPDVTPNDPPEDEFDDPQSPDEPEEDSFPDLRDDSPPPADDPLEDPPGEGSDDPTDEVVDDLIEAEAPPPSETDEMEEDDPTQDMNEVDEEEGEDDESLDLDSEQTQDDVVSETGGPASPEPASAGLALAGIAALTAAMGRRRRRERRA